MNERVMFQFFVKGKLSEEAIKKLLSDLFDTNRVSCLTSGNATDVFYEYQYYKGNFNTSIECYILEELVKNKGIDSDKDLGLLVSKALGKQVLVSNEQINPYTWLLIENDKIYEANQIDGDDDTILIEKNVRVALPS